jgi:hypothetical protein
VPVTQQPQNESGVGISWTTIRYRTVLLIVLIIVLLIGVGSYIIMPGETMRMMDSLSGFMQKHARLPGSDNSALKPGPQEAHFTNIDGDVRVRRANSSTWEVARFSTALQKGDVVQTSAEGLARITFVDGTSYTIKPDSLIVVEENSANERQQTHVAVQVTTGTVDLSTGTFSQGSQSQLVMAGAVANFAPDTVARANNNARSDEHELLVAKGSGTMARGNEVVEMAQFDRVSYKTSQPFEKSHELAPPILVNPNNMLPVYTTANQPRVLDFTWTPVDSASGYHIRVSRNPYFTSMVVDKKTIEPSLTGVSLGEGSYYWSVQSVDGRGHESLESERDRFSVVAKSSPTQLALSLDPFIQHGHVIEVIGRTEPDARVMVNGDEVPMVGSDGSFRYFTPQLPNGEDMITVTAQNSKGAVNTLTRKVLIQ